MVHLQIALCSRQILAEHKFKANFAPRCLTKSYSFSHRTSELRAAKHDQNNQDCTSCSELHLPRCCQGFIMANPGLNADCAVR
jgi:hypothetical protein